MKIAWSLYYDNNVVCNFYEDDSGRKADNWSKIQKLSEVLNLPDMCMEIRLWLLGSDINFKQFSKKYKPLKVVRSVKAEDTICVDYDAIKNESYYDMLGVQDRLLEIMSLTYENHAEIARVLGVSNALISQAYNGKTLCTKLYKLTNILKKINSNMFYVLCGDERYKFEPYININLSCLNLYRHYKRCVYKYRIPKSLTVSISKLKSGKISDFHISTIYSFSKVYNKPVWWLIQDEASSMIYPNKRRVQCPI